MDLEEDLRSDIVVHYRWLADSHMNQGTSGNISVRIHPNRILITPSSIRPSDLQPDMIALMDLNGSWSGSQVPSSEWRFHVEIMKARPEVNAIVHTHSMFATIQSMTRRPIPACHYLIAVLGGNNIRCAPYATFGSQELADVAVAALQDRMACLLSNHGAISLGSNLRQAVDHAVLLETISQQYFYASLARVHLLSDDEITETKQALRQLMSYGAGVVRS